MIEDDPPGGDPVVVFDLSVNPRERQTVQRESIVPVEWVIDERRLRPLWVG